jgi:hypothetical protein
MASFYLLINIIDSFEKHMLRQRSVKRIEFHFDQKAVHWTRYSLNKLNN